MLVRQKRKATDQNSQTWKQLFWVKLPQPFHAGIKKKNTYAKTSSSEVVWPDYSILLFYHQARIHSGVVGCFFSVILSFGKYNVILRFINIIFIILSLDIFLFPPYCFTNSSKIGTNKSHVANYRSKKQTRLFLETHRIKEISLEMYLHVLRSNYAEYH